VDLVIGPTAVLAQHEAPKTDKRFNVMASAENNWDVFQHVEESAKKLNPFVGLMPVPAKRVSSSSCRRDLRIPSSSLTLSI
jgi:hypothetical protein